MSRTSENRDEVIKVMVTKEEKQIIARQAAKENRSVSSYGRNQMLPEKEVEVKVE